TIMAAIRPAHPGTVSRSKEIPAPQPTPAARVANKDGVVQRRKSVHASRPTSGPSAINRARPLNQLTEKRVPAQSAAATRKVGASSAEAAGGSAVRIEEIKTIPARAA